MANRVAKQIVASLLLSLLITHAVAHTPVIATSPKNGSVLKTAPPSIEISFHDPVRLTSIVAIETGKAERKLDFTPTDSAAKFTVTDPKLGAGRIDIQWKALSKDGHVISGSFVFTIEAAAATTN